MDWGVGIVKLSVEEAIVGLHIWHIIRELSTWSVVNDRDRHMHSYGKRFSVALLHFSSWAFSIKTDISIRSGRLQVAHS